MLRMTLLLLMCCTIHAGACFQLLGRLASLELTFLTVFDDRLLRMH
jgi:hypothetical protein